jgi:hypothetical protein
MLVEGRIETTTFKEYFAFLKPVGLDMAGERRLLYQRVALETNCRVASKWLVIASLSRSNAPLLRKRSIQTLQMIFDMERPQ